MLCALRDPRRSGWFSSLSSHTSLVSLASSAGYHHSMPQRVRRPSALDSTAVDSIPRSSFRERMPIYSPSYSDLSSCTRAAKISVELVNTIDKNLKAVNLKGFSDALYVNDLIWILGWKRKLIGTKHTVLLNTQSPKYTVQVKRKRPDELAYLPSIMLLHKEQIYYARIGGKEILTFNTHSHSFNLSYSNHSLSIGAMCCDKHHLYIIDQKHMDRIKVLDYMFCHKTDIQTGISDTEHCFLDMCLVPNPNTDHPGSASGCTAGTVDNVIVISKSAPYGFIRAVYHDGQLLWQIDGCTSPELGTWFNPSSVTSTASGQIYVADKDNDKIYSISADGNNIQELLGRSHGIHRPSRVTVDKRGERLLVIHKDGAELNNYQIKMESFVHTRWMTEPQTIPAKKLNQNYSYSSLSSSHLACSSIGTHDASDWEVVSGRDNSSGFYSSTSLQKICESDGVKLKDLSVLARRIAPQKMSQIAVEHLDIDLDRLDTIEAECRNNSWKFNLRILTEWTNRGPGHNRLKLASILYEASEEGLVNFDVVTDILGGS